MSKIEPKIIQEPLKRNGFQNFNNELSGDSSSDFGSLFGMSSLATPMSIESEIGSHPVNFSIPSREIVEDMSYSDGNVQSNLIDNASLLSAEMADEFDNSEIGFFNVIPSTEISIDKTGFIGESVIKSDSKKVIPDNLEGSFGSEFQHTVSNHPRLNAEKLPPNVNGALNAMHQNSGEKTVANADQTEELKKNLLGFEGKKTTSNTDERLFVIKDTSRPKFAELENGKNQDTSRPRMAADLIDRGRLMYADNDAKGAQHQSILENQTLKNASEIGAPSNLQKGILLDRPMPNPEVRKILSSSVSSDVGATLLSSDADQGSAHQGGSNSGTTGGNLAKASQTQMLDMIDILDTAQENWSEVLLNRIKNGIRGKKDFIELQLSPKNLGKLRIALMVQNDQTSIRVQTENSVAAAMVAETNPKLAQMLEAAGFRLTDFNSSFGNQAGSQAFDKNNDRNTNEAANAKSREEESVNPDGLVDRSDVSKSSENLINIEA